MSLIDRQPELRAEGESRVAFRASWDFFLALTRELENQNVRVAFDGEYVELMSPGMAHERYKHVVNLLVPPLAGVLGLPCFGIASTLWKSARAERGLEPDEAYYLSREKLEAATALPDDAHEFPPPDLAVEIDLRPSRLDRPSIYASLGVAEVWRLVEDAFVFEALGDDGRYHRVEASPKLRIRPEELDAWVIHRALGDDNEIAAEFRAWAADRFDDES